MYLRPLSRVTMAMAGTIAPVKVITALTTPEQAAITPASLMLVLTCLLRRRLTVIEVRDLQTPTPNPQPLNRDRLTARYRRQARNETREMAHPFRRATVGRARKINTNYRWPAPLTGR